MKYQRLGNSVILVTAVTYFAVTGQPMKMRILCEELLIISQRFFGIPLFRFLCAVRWNSRNLSRGTFSRPETPGPAYNRN
jgi:hypothetical protein